MSRTPEEILAASKELLLNFKKSAPVPKNEVEEFRLLDIRYPRITKIYTVLVPENYEWKSVTIDVYQDCPSQQIHIEVPFTIVRHGHPKQLVCFAPHFCHVYGYAPVGNESATFLKAWKEKWG